MSVKSRILAWWYRQSFSAEVIDLRELLLSAAQEVLDKNEMDAAAFAEANEARYWEYLRTEIDRDNQRGISPVFGVVEASTRRLRWHPFRLMRADETRLKKIGASLESRPLILHELDRLNSRQYEVANCVVGEIAGARRVRLTPRGSEGGIDFFMEIPLPGRCHLFSGTTGPLRIVGQCKKHERRIEPGMVRDFVTSMENVKKQEPSVEPLVPGWFRAAAGPLVGWFTGHHGFQSGAKRFGRNHGIILSDSLDLAEIAALSRALACDLRPRGRAVEFRRRIDQGEDRYVSAA